MGFPVFDISIGFISKLFTGGILLNESKLPEFRLYKQAFYAGMD